MPEQPINEDAVPPTSEVPTVSDQRPKRITKGQKVKHTKTDLRGAVHRCNGTVTSFLRELGYERGGVVHNVAREWLEEHDLLDEFESRRMELADEAIEVVVKNLRCPGKRQLKTAIFILTKMPNDFFNPKGDNQEGGGMSQMMQLVQHALSAGIQSQMPIDITAEEIRTGDFDV